MGFFLDSGEQSDYPVVFFAMIKRRCLQFLRAFFIFAILAGFNVSTLKAYRCAVMKAGPARCCQKTLKDSGKHCCKNGPAKESSTERCCKMTHCILDRKQETIVERNEGDTALIAAYCLRLINLQPITISDKPLCHAVLAGPCAAELCVFLC